MLVERGISRRDKGTVELGRLLYGRVFPHVRGRGATRLGNLSWFSDRRAIVVEGDMTLTLPALDPYWARYFYTEKPYEPEVARALTLLGSVGPALFLDCGANFGYWSAKVAAGVYGRHEVVAIEASRSTYDMLQANVTGALFSAISDSVGEVRFDNSLEHAGRQISESGGDVVPSTTIDTLADGAPRVIVKLDVEGAEATALQGAQRSLTGDIAFVYEDHGSDPTCASTSAMLAAGLEVYSVYGETVTPMRDVTDVLRLKTDSFYGYNFIAAHGAYAATAKTASAPPEPTQGPAAAAVS